MTSSAVEPYLNGRQHLSSVLGVDHGDGDVLLLQLRRGVWRRGVRDTVGLWGRGRCLLHHHVVSCRRGQRLVVGGRGGRSHREGHQGSRLQSVRVVGARSGLANGNSPGLVVESESDVAVRPGRKINMGVFMSVIFARFWQFKTGKCYP